MLFQSFGDIGEEAANEADTVTAVEFDEEGNYLATGDRGGRIVLFKSTGVAKKTKSRKGFSATPTQECKGGDTKLWSPFFQFQSHETEFDYLKSLEIEEKINQIKFCKSNQGKIFVLSTNDKTIKLWKISEKHAYDCEAVSSVQSHRISSPKDLPLPQRRKTNSANFGIDGSTTASTKRVFQHAHAYHINSLSLNSDGETFLSSDDLTINLWNLERSHCSFNIIDIKPSMMEDLSEVITCAKFHPEQCNLLAHATSKGIISLCDLRTGATINRTPAPTPVSTPVRSSFRMASPAKPPSLTAHPAVKVFQPSEEGFRSSYSEMLSSISDIHFSRDGRYLISRDYMTVKVWDVNMNSSPVATINVHDHLRTKLPSLHDSDAIFDKFELFVSSKSQRIVTGSYNNTYYIYNFEGEKVGDPVTLPKKSPDHLGSPGGFDSLSNGLRKLNLRNVRVDQKILHGCCHPTSNVVAIAGQTGLFMYSFN